MDRSKKLTDFLNSLRNDLPSFDETDFSNISATNHEGENALHLAISRDEFEIAEELIRLGIDLDARGDLGNTPLHCAASSGKMNFVKLLVENGVDLFAFNEGYPPFTLARFSKHDQICDYLGEKMREKQSHDKAVYVKSKIKFLEREIDRLKKSIE